MGPMYFDYGFRAFQMGVHERRPADLAKTTGSPWRVLPRNRNPPGEIRGQMQDNIKWIAEAGRNNLVVGSQARILYADCAGRINIALAFNKAIKEKAD